MMTSQPWSGANGLKDSRGSRQLKWKKWNAPNGERQCQQCHVKTERVKSVQNTSQAKSLWLTMAQVNSSLYCRLDGLIKC